MAGRVKNSYLYKYNGVFICAFCKHWMTLFALSRLTLICCSDMRASVLHIDQFSYLSPDLRSQKDCRRCFQPGLEESNGGGGKTQTPLFLLCKTISMECLCPWSTWSICLSWGFCAGCVPDNAGDAHLHLGQSVIFPRVWKPMLDAFP